MNIKTCNNGKKENMQQTWKKLVSELDKLSMLNNMNRTNKSSNKP